jgi:hypothetical protein
MHEDGTPRRFSDECCGKAANSDGWLPLSDAWKQFRSNSQEVWEAQHTCQQGDRSLLVYPHFRRERHCVRDYVPDPANGPIITGTDFGYENPACVLWAQRLSREVEVTMADGSRRVLSPFTRVVFAETYIANKTSEWLADNVMERERAWRERFPKWRVWLRFGDAAALDARGLWAARGLHTVRYGTRDLGRSIGYVREAFEDNQIVIDLKCRNLIEEIEGYSYEDQQAGRQDKGNPIKDHDHAVDGLRYALTGLRHWEHKIAKQGGEANPAHVQQTPAQRQTAAGEPRYQSIRTYG